MQSIELGKWALSGDEGKDRRMMDDAPNNYKNVLKMKSGIGRKDEQIFLDWFPSEERAATFMPSVR